MWERQKEETKFCWSFEFIEINEPVMYTSGSAHLHVKMSASDIEKVIYTPDRSYMAINVSESFFAVSCSSCRNDECACIEHDIDCPS